jgi:hypothetical protein
VRLSWSSLLLCQSRRPERDLELAELPFSAIFYLSMVEIAMKKVNNGFLRHFGDTEKAKLFNNECDIHCAFDHPDHI